MFDEVRKRPLVAIIDDDEATRLILKRLLNKACIHSITADDGEVGLALVRDTRPDLILLDLFMPGEDGFEILRKFRADSALKDIPVIIFTVLEREKSRIQALEMGATDYVTKPFDMRDLVARICKYLGRDE